MSEYYEDPGILSEYLLFHYGAPERVLPWDFGPRNSVDFPMRIAHQFCHHYPQQPHEAPLPSRALDLGCAVGRSAFELTRWYEQVVGIDYSQAFIDAAVRLQREGSLSFRFRNQGEQFDEAVCELPHGVDSGRVQFLRGDAMQLRALDLGTFDLILASNLICRLPDPAAFLAGLAAFLRRDGLLVLSTPYTYLESFTPKALWLGGQADGVPAANAVASVLKNALTPVEEADLPMLIREHARKYQWTVCHTSIWKKTLPS